MTDLTDLIYSQALTSIAVGETRENTVEFIREHYPYVAQHVIDRELRQALADAQRQGVEREDIDDSWFTRSFA